MKTIRIIVLTISLLTLCFTSVSGAEQAKNSTDCPQIQIALPADFHEAVTKAEALAEKDEYKAAARSLITFVKAHPEPSFAYISYDIGYFLYQAKAYKEAIPYLKKSIALAPCFAQGRQLLANALYDAGDIKAAAVALQKEAAMTKNPDLMFQAAVFWMEAKIPKNALPLLKDLEKRPSPKSDWLVALSNVLGELNQKKETAQAMEKAARSGNDPNLYFHAAWLWTEADQPGQALALLEILAKRKTVKTDWLLLLCNTYLALDRTPDAARAMDRAVAQDPKPANLYSAGVLWLQSEKPAKARKHLLKLVKLPDPEADWFVALSQAWAISDNYAKAAPAMEKAFDISRKPEHAYQAGVMRLQLKQPDKALAMLKFLEALPHPKAEWLVALSNAWVMKENFNRAAPVMERAATISKKNEHYFRASQLWLQAQKPCKALPLLKLLSRRPSPKAVWLIALSNTHLLLEQPLNAAKAMERAAGISKEGKHYFRAAMLWHQCGDSQKIMTKTIALLRLSVAKDPVEQRWLIELSDRLIQTGKDREALTVMKRTRLANSTEASGLCYRGALLWLNLNKPRKALPILEFLCQKPGPDYAWLSSLVRLNMELERPRKADRVLCRLLEAFPLEKKAWRLAVWMAREQADYARAAAAMAVAVHLDPDDKASLKALAQYYQMAGVPAKAAGIFQTLGGPSPKPEDWDRIKDIYLSGKLYENALEAARSAVSAEQTPQRWEAVGDITFLMHQYEDSAMAYSKAADLADTLPVRLKAAYALMKQDKLEQASRLFHGIQNQDTADDTLRKEASQALAYVRSIQALMPENATTPLTDITTGERIHN